MRLRNKTANVPGDQGEEIDHEEEMDSDGDELYPNAVVSKIITRGPFTQRDQPFKL